jgi:RNA polymerase sigma-70 factor (ECF subfamily)
VQANDLQFRGWVEQHQSMVYSIALRLTGDTGLAEEVAQDCFVALHSSLAQIVDEDHLRFWLRRVAVHRATDCCRRRALRPEARAEEWMEEYEAHAEDRYVQERASGFTAKVETLLASLPEAMRVAVVLRYQEEMRPEEIAVLLGLPVATLKSHLQRGLTLLRQKANVMLKEYVRE